MEKQTMSTELKVKIKSLAAEAKIIRAEETKLLRKVELAPKLNARTGEMEQRFRTVRNAPGRAGLRGHRITVVRSEARHSLLAYGYLRGTAYKAMEAKCWEAPSWSSVSKMIVRFGGSIDKADFEAWCKGAVPIAKAA